MKMLQLLAVLTLATIAGAALGGSDQGAHAWRASVPEAAKDRQSPLAADPDAPVAGEKLFLRHCASCHGKAAEGRGKKPSLKTDNVRHSAPGELEWLLQNGIMRHGMPSWSQLPELQRWQIVAFLKEALQK